MQYTEKELSKLIEDVEKEFTAHLAKAEEDFKSKLAKSEDSETTAQPLAKAEEEKKEEEKKPEAKEEPAKAEEKEESKEKAPESKPEEKAPEAEAKEAPSEEAKEGEEKHAEEKPAAEGEDHCDYDDEDMKHMHDMYSSMSKAELKAHHEAVKKAYEHHGLEKCGEMMMAKSESDVAVEVKPSPEVDLLKSEIEAEKAKNAELKKTLETVTEFITKLANKKSAPAAKAITSLEVIAKSESAKEEEKQLTKGEITEILKKKAADPKLEKSDRDAINDYYIGSRSIEKIKHLLK